jgi:aryl-alcohol dehydrogenase-like predicted oxidoreductase
VVSLRGAEVPRIGFGTLYITVERGFGPARADAGALLREAARLGVRLFDTADSYGAGAAEEAVREALHPYDGLLVTTKGGYRHDRPGAWVTDARPEHLRRALEGSLRRLELENIEFYQLHCADPRVPYAESVGTLDDLRRAGKIRHIGISNATSRGSRSPGARPRSSRSRTPSTSAIVAAPRCSTTAPTTASCSFPGCRSATAEFIGTTRNCSVFH